MCWLRVTNEKKESEFLMRAYGLPRESNFKYPDSFDVATYGLKSRAGTYRATTSKQATRRMWARKARLEGRNECLEAMASMREEAHEEAHEEARELAREQEAREEYEQEMLDREFLRDILEKDAEYEARTGEDSFSAKMREKREEREEREDYSRNLRDCWEYDIMMDNLRYHSEPIKRFIPALPQPGMTLSQLLASRRAA